MLHADLQKLVDDLTALDAVPSAAANFFEAALHAAEIGTWRLDMVGGQVLRDEITSRIFGLEPSRAPDEALVAVHPDDKPTVASSLQRSFEEGEQHDTEFRVLLPDGGIRWVRGIARPLSGPDGRRRWLHGIVMDITKRKESELALRESQRQLSTLIHNLPGVAYRCPVEGPWIMDYISDGVEEITGHAPQTWLSGKIGWAEIVHPDDAEGLGREIDQAVAQRRMFSATYRIIHRSGAIRWVLERGQAIYDEEGAPVCLEGFVGDVTEQKLLEHSLREAKARAHHILDTVPQIIWATDAQGQTDYLSPQWYAFTGRPEGADLGSIWIEALHPDDRAIVYSLWQRSLETERPFEAEFRLLQACGSWRWILTRAVPERDHAGKISRWYGTCTDVHERVLAQQALGQSEAFNRSILDSTPDCITMLDLDGRILFVNRLEPRALETGDAGALLGASWPDLLLPEAQLEARLALAKARKGDLARFTAMQPVLGGKPKWWDIVATPVTGDDGKPSQVVVVSRDVTHQKQSEERVRWLANHDSLTGLPNRLLFQERLDEAVASGSSNAKFALLLIDVDEFKRVNDTLGHDAGDGLLCTFATRLREAARSDDLVARLGGDEFAVILNGVGSEEEVLTAVQSLLAAVRQPWVHAGMMLDCNASIGASLYPIDGEARAELLKHADIALYVAKAAGRGNLKLFQPSMRSEMQHRISMLALARDALDRDWIAPFYQPKVDLRSGRIDGFEALLRWHHPRNGFQSPDTIVAAFDDLNLAAEISDRMIECVVADIRGWLDAGVDFGSVAINAAAAEFRRGDFAERLLERLAEARVPATHVQLEVTETVFLGRGADYVERALKMLSAAGVKIALDDFGTGYASLSHLKQFPVDLLKIDRSFVRDLGSDADAGAIVRAVINLGQSLDIKTTAEGIETITQAAQLKAYGCDYGQGYLYSKAVPADQVAQMVGVPARRAGGAR